MRDLEFRAYIDENGQKSFEHIDLNAANADELARFHAVTNNHGVIKEQYTGLKDKNGKKIYEGDIVRYAIRPSLTTVVEWRYREEEYYPCCTTSGFSLPYSEDGYEVIGNVHENPELLEVKDVD